MRPFPAWLHTLSWTYLVVCGICSVFLIADLLQGTKQKMWIMNLVWPITALYFGPVAVWLYLRTRPFSVQQDHKSMQKMKTSEVDHKKARPEQVATAVFHCGAGCTLGDVIAESRLFAIGGTAFIAGSDFLSKMAVDFALAYAFGIVFQYFTIVPMRNLSFLKGIAAAAKADTVSILAFEIGMFVWMAITYYKLFPEPHLHPNEAVFWFMMQIAMIIGWVTSYPANVWLLKKGWKERMPEM